VLLTITSTLCNFPYTQGKTIQTIATILDNRPKLQHARPGAKHPPAAPDLEERVREDAKWQDATHSWRHEMEMNNVTKKIWPKGAAAGARAGTLVVCPVIALSQWKSEIEKFTERGPLSVGIYHGPDREKVMPREMMSKYDVVLTTYQVLEQDFRKMVSPNKVACPNCGAKYKIDKLPVHLKYFCGDGAQRTEAQMRQRRTAPRQGRANDGQDGGGNGKGSAKKKPPMKSLVTTEEVAKQNLKLAPAKSNLKIHRSKDYDSDSDLSVEESNKRAAVSRPSRSAALNATRRVSASFKEWNAESSKLKKRNAACDDDDDDESYSDEDCRSSETDQSLSDDSMTVKKLPSKKSAAPRQKRSRSDTSSEGDVSGEDEEALARARASQRKALDAARRGKKAIPGSKKEAKGNAKGKGTTPARGKKKKFENPSSSDDSTDDDDDVDPLEGVDMDELMGEAMAGARFSVLHGFTWWRCVLDEAHFIKSRSSQTAASAFALTSVHRWCLSGTPLQNRVGELYSLIRFVRLDPMSHYFCRQCPCKSIHYRMRQGVCQDCGHRAFSHFSHFNKHVLNPIQRDGYTGDGRRAVFILKSDVLDKCLLRRTKENRAEDMNLPPRLVTIRPVRLHPVEEDFYNALYTQTKSSFDDYVAEGTVLNNYAHIFVSLMRWVPLF
jgi:DNA repair protein RAD16